MSIFRYIVIILVLALSGLAVFWLVLLSKSKTDAVPAAPAESMPIEERARILESVRDTDSQNTPLTQEERDSRLDVLRQLQESSSGVSQDTTTAEGESRTQSGSALPESSESNADKMKILQSL